MENANFNNRPEVNHESEQDDETEEKDKKKLKKFLAAVISRISNKEETTEDQESNIKEPFIRRFFKEITQSKDEIESEINDEETSGENDEEENRLNKEFIETRLETVKEDLQELDQEADAIWESTADFILLSKLSEILNSDEAPVPLDELVKQSIEEADAILLPPSLEVSIEDIESPAQEHEAIISALENETITTTVESRLENQPNEPDIQEEAKPETVSEASETYKPPIKPAETNNEVRTNSGGGTGTTIEDRPMIRSNAQSPVLQDRQPNRIEPSPDLIQSIDEPNPNRDSDHSYQTRPNVVIGPPLRVGNERVAYKRVEEPANNRNSENEINRPLENITRINYERPKVAKSPEDYDLRELLQAAEQIYIDGKSLRKLYEYKQLDSASLRSVVLEGLRGGDVKKAYKKEQMRKNAREMLLNKYKSGSNTSLASSAPPSRTEQQSSSTNQGEITNKQSKTKEDHINSIINGDKDKTGERKLAVTVTVVVVVLALIILLLLKRTKF